MANTNQEFWDGFAHTYSRMELVNFQSGFSTFVLAKTNSPGARVLEVGCGSGIGTEIAAQSLLSKEGSPVLVACDFSIEMINLLKQRIDESGFPLI